MDALNRTMSAVAGFTAPENKIDLALIDIGKVEAQLNKSRQTITGARNLYADFYASVLPKLSQRAKDLSTTEKILSDLKTYVTADIAELNKMKNDVKDVPQAADIIQDKINVRQKLLTEIGLSIVDCETTRTKLENIKG